MKHTFNALTGKFLQTERAEAGEVKKRLAEKFLFSYRIGMVVVTVFCLTIPLFAGEIHVFAAASLTDSLNAAAQSYEKSSGDKILFNFGASNFLEKQIEEGAPADVFFSADEKQMDNLDKKGFLLADSRHTVLSNTLVVVVPSDSALIISTANDLNQPQIHRIAIADPAGVPAGVYAKQYLVKLKLWDVLASRMVPANNVRAALAAVEYGNVDAAIVYKTDAAISHKVRVAFEVPLKGGPRISYPIAVVKATKFPDESKKFSDYIRSAKGLEIFSQYGFLAPDEGKK